MYHFCEALGVSGEDKEHKKEKRSRKDFDSHAQFIYRNIQAAIDFLSKKSKLPKKTFYDIISIWSDVCDELLFNPVLTRESDEDIISGYIRYGITPLIAGQIFILHHSDAQSETFLYHINKFFTGNYVWHNSMDLLRKEHPEILPDEINHSYLDFCIHSGIREYLKEYIGLLNFEYKENISIITTSIDNIKIGSYQKASTIIGKIRACKGQIDKKDVRFKNENKVHDYIEKLDKLETAYVAMLSLLYFENKTEWCSELYHKYNEFYNLYKTPNSTTGDKIWGIDPDPAESTKQLIDILASLHVNYDKENSKTRIRPLIQWIYENKINHTQLSDVICWSQQVAKSISHLGECVYPHTMQIEQNNPCVIIDNSINEIIIDADKSGQYSDVLNPYVNITEVLGYIQRNDLPTALHCIKQHRLKKYSLFGFASYTFSMLYIGLQYKLGKIGNNGLTEYIREVNDNIGIIDIGMLHSSILKHMNLESDYDLHSIYSPYSESFHSNFSLIWSLWTYNIVAIKLDAAHYKQKHNVQNIYSLEPFVQSAPQPNRKILDELNRVAGKLLKGLKHLAGISEPKEFMAVILAKKVLTRNLLEKNLISHVEGSTLSVCMLDYESLIKHLSLPGSDLNNIIELGKEPAIVTLLFQAMLLEKRSKQSDA